MRNRRSGGAGGGLWLHAATIAKADAIIIGLDNLTNTSLLELGGNRIDQRIA